MRGALPGRTRLHRRRRGPHGDSDRWPRHEHRRRRRDKSGLETGGDTPGLGAGRDLLALLRGRAPAESARRNVAGLRASCHHAAGEAWRAAWQPSGFADDTPEGAATRRSSICCDIASVSRPRKSGERDRLPSSATATTAPRSSGHDSPGAAACRPMSMNYRADHAGPARGCRTSGWRRRRLALQDRIPRRLHAVAAWPGRRQAARRPRRAPSRGCGAPFAVLDIDERARRAPSMAATFLLLRPGPARRVARQPAAG